MTDFHTVLPNFAQVADRYASILAGLETHRIGLSELLTLDAAEIGKRTRLPLLELQRFSEEVRRALAGGGDGGQGMRGPFRGKPVPTGDGRPQPRPPDRRNETKESERSEDKNKNEGQNEQRVETKPSRRGEEALPMTKERREDPKRPKTPVISTLDGDLDHALNGGFPVGYLSEVVGESGAGKTQLLLSLLLAVQLPPPHGLGRHALYIATEAPLPTGRLAQMMRTAPAELGVQKHCSLQAIATINTPDLEAQEHILTHQLPVQLAKAPERFGLVVVDSVAANFRPFFGGGGKNSSLAARSLELTRLGMLLRSLAQQYNLAVVVANQVADRFDGEGSDSWGGGGGLGPGTPRWSGAGRPAYGANSATNTAKRPRLPPTQQQLMPATQESPLAARSRQQQGLPLPAGASSSQELGGAAAATSSQPDPNSTQPSKPAIQPPPPPPPPPLLPPSSLDLPTQYIPSSLPPQSQFPSAPPPPPVLQLDHQQRWFTGWGDDPGGVYRSGDAAGPLGMRNKTPSLGLVWATQLAMRVALVKAPRIGRGIGEGGADDREYRDEELDPTGAVRLRHSWRRWMKVVFAPHAAATGSEAEAARPAKQPTTALATRMQGAVEFEITMGGLKAVKKKTK